MHFYISVVSSGERRKRPGDRRNCVSRLLPAALLMMTIVVVIVIDDHDHDDDDPSHENMIRHSARWRLGSSPGKPIFQSGPKVVEIDEI